MSDGFEIIPVVDLMGGLAVRAAGGDRARYQPLISPLSPDASPLGAVRGLLGLAPFARLYLADLDGIEGRGIQHEVISELESALPGVELWVDAGLADAMACRAWQERHRARIVLGSECLRDAGLPARIGTMMSLDFRGGALLGDATLLTDATRWPHEVIAMTLDRVGERCGPDLVLLADLVARGGMGAKVYAAGGVRNNADVAALRALGVAGALVSTALHTGVLSHAR